MRNARLDDSQAGIKISGRNIYNLRYADDTTLMSESKEKLSEVKSPSGVRLFATPWTSSLPGSSLHGILQARVLKWVAIKGWAYNDVCMYAVVSDSLGHHRL